MLPSKTIRSLLGDAASVEGLRAAISAIETQFEENSDELHGMPARRAAAAIADDPLETLAAIRRREDELLDLLEIAESQIGLLRKRLATMDGQVELDECRKRAVSAIKDLASATECAREALKDLCDVAA
jgi:hypothetical protein